ncbi:MAG: hypothetical protein WDO15_25290 [Bacteroidota bacterium]
MYERFGKRDKIDMVEGFHKHQFSVPNQEAVLNFMEKNLSQIAQITQIKQKELSEKELWVTTKGQVTVEFPNEIKLMDLVQQHYKDHQSVTHGIDYKSNHGKVTIEKQGEDRYVLHHSEYLKMTVRYYRGKGKKTVILLDTTAISTRLKNGESVITFDFRGADKDNNSLASVMANYVYNSLLLGRPYFLEMIEDVEIVTTFARNDLGLKEIVIAGGEDTHLLLEQIAKVIPNIKVENSSGGLTWSQIINEKRETWPIQYLMPGGAYIK